ncbi:MAG: hypothetical protein AAF666_04020 [Pseudomonadota bacterium]
MNWRTMVAILCAGLVFLAMLRGLRLVNYMPMLAAIGTFFAVWIALRPSKKESEAPPDSAVEELTQAGNRLMEFAKNCPPADVPLFQHLAKLIRVLRDHHRASPDHIERTRSFRRHALPRMIGAIEDYLDLARRAGSDQDDRLAEISRQLEGFVPVLEKIDKACIENDLIALEVNIEVLNEQLDRRR